MARITQTVNSYTIDSDGNGTGVLQIDDGNTFAGAIVTQGGLRVDSLNTIGLVTTSGTGVIQTTATADGAIILGSAATGFASLAAGSGGNIVQDDGAAFASVAVSGDVLIAVGGAVTAQPALISGKGSTATADDADIILILDATDNALKQQTRGNFLAGAAGTPAGNDGEVQYNDGGAFGADAAFTTDKAGTVTMTSLVVGNNASAIDAGAGNATIFASLGANTLTVGGVNTTTVFPGSLTVEGTTTFIDSTNLRVEDKVIDLNSDAAGAGVGSNAGAGLNILSNVGANTVTFLTLADGGPLSSSSGLDVAIGNEYSIAGVSTLSATTLGSTVVNSSLTAVGTIATGVWQGTTVGVAYGGTGQTSYVDGELLIGNSVGNTLTKSTLTAGTGISISNGNGSIEIAATGASGNKTTGTYSAGVTQNIDFSIPTGSRTNVAFRATIYLEDSTTNNSAMVLIDGIVVRSTGAPLLPDFVFVVVPGTDGDKVTLGTGGANTLRFVVNTPAGSGNFVSTVEYTED